MRRKRRRTGFRARNGVSARADGGVHVETECCGSVAEECGSTDFWVGKVEHIRFVN